ncbi:hypothetical protein TNCV_1987531 [Trichonephila clavipes]|nr:hypothetical protein TNCV_1987531 [Trichonephila clavipes]
MAASAPLTLRHWVVVQMRLCTERATDMWDLIWRCRVPCAFQTGIEGGLCERIPPRRVKETNGKEKEGSARAKRFATALRNWCKEKKPISLRHDSCSDTLPLFKFSDSVLFLVAQRRTFRSPTLQSRILSSQKRGLCTRLFGSPVSLTYDPVQVELFTVKHEENMKKKRHSRFENFKDFGQDKASDTEPSNVLSQSTDTHKEFQ